MNRVYSRFISLQHKMKVTLMACLLLVVAPVMSAPVLEKAILPDEAVAVIEQYFNALSEGDTNTIRSLLGPSLLKQRERMLQNPTYSTYLIKHYNNIQHTISVPQLLNDNTVAIKVELSRDNTIQHKYQFILRLFDQSAIRIDDEEEISY